MFIDFAKINKRKKKPLWHLNQIYSHLCNARGQGPVCMGELDIEHASNLQQVTVCSQKFEFEKKWESRWTL